MYEKLLIFLIIYAIDAVDSKAQLLNNKLVTARQEFPGFSFVDLYIRSSDLFRENCDIESRYCDPYVHNSNNVQKKEISYILSDSNHNSDFQCRYHQKLELTNLKYITCPAGHIRENCSGICVLPNKLQLKGCWSEYPSIIFDKDSYKLNGYYVPKVAAIKFNLMNEIKNDELTWYVNGDDDIAFFWRSMICFNIKKSGSEYTGILRYDNLDKSYRDYSKKLYFEFFAKWTAKE